jgi:hypothetical protein
MIHQYRHNGINPFYTYETLGRTSIQMNESDYQVITDFINGVKPLVVYHDKFTEYCVLNIKHYKVEYKKDRISLSSDAYTHKIDIIFQNNYIDICDGTWRRAYLIKSQVIKNINRMIEKTKEHLKELNDFKKGLDK